MVIYEAILDRMQKQKKAIEGFPPRFIYVGQLEEYRFVFGALEKEIPKRPYTEISERSQDGYYCCPVCKNNIEVIGFSAFRKKYKMNAYCSYCGQAIDWSGENDL